MNDYYLQAQMGSYQSLLNQQIQQAGGLQQFMGGIGMGVQGGGAAHLGMVKTFRKNFKEYTKEEFRHLSNQPMIKHILIGMTTLNKEQIADRVKEHLDNMEA